MTNINIKKKREGAAMSVKVGDWVRYTCGGTYFYIDEVLACQMGYYVIRGGEWVYPSQIIESRPPQGEKEPG